MGASKSLLANPKVLHSNGMQVKASWQIPMYYILMGASEIFLANPKVLHSNGCQ